MKYNLFVLTLLLLGMERWSSAADGRERRKRFLIEPAGTQMGMFGTISIPLEYMKQVSVAYFFEGNYYTLNNVTWLEPFLLGPTITTARRNKRSADNLLFKSLSRRFAYIVLENHIERVGLPGRACLLRALCEHAEHPLHHNGVLGDILYVIFTPSSSRSEDLPLAFHQAEEDGRAGDCSKYTRTCPTSLIDTFSKFGQHK